MSDEDDFLSRWSRRKRSVAAEDESPASGKTEEPQPDPEAEPETEEEEDALLLKLGLPKPESLGPGDDFRAFMSNGVPQFLQRRALRVLWRSNPVLANLDGLNDYDADFTSPELTKKILATGYQVGRGFVSRAVQSVADSAPVEPVEVAAEELTVKEGEISETTLVPEAEDPGEPQPEPAPRPRRMRFET